MATATTYSDREFLFRLQTLIIDGGTGVLRNIFDQKLQKSTLNVFLANEQTSINRLRGQNTITKAQYDLLFPPGGQLPKSAKFDITLIVCLLRNLKSFGLNPKYKWNTQPQPTDISVEADLCRLKGFRNKIAHISSTSGFNKTRFQSKWIDIEQVLLRLNKAVPFSVPGLKKTIDSYKHSPLEPAAEKRIQAVIDQWREMEKGLVEEIKKVKDDATEVKHNVEIISRDVKDVKNDVEEVQGNIRKVKDDVTEVKDNAEIMSKDVKDVKNDVEEVQGNIREVKDDITEVKGNAEIMSRYVKDVKNDVKEVQGNIRKVKDDVTEVKDNAEIMSKDVKDVKNDVEEVQGNIIEVKDDVTVVKGNAEIMSRDVSEVKNDVKEVQENIREVKDDVTEVKGNVKNVIEDVRKVKELVTNQKEMKESDKMKEFQDDLISFYRDQYGTISLSPLIEKETPLLEFYVMPDICSLKVERTPSGVNEEKTKVISFENLFYNNDRMCRKIYLTADAGLGKTAFSKRLALIWCHANENEGQNIILEMEEIKAIKKFRFVFLLLLRNSSNECDIDDIITNQIISHLPRPYSRKFLETILFEKKCLVILDGLDEWSHPSNSCRRLSHIPHRKVRERTAVLTTTRPWKLSMICLPSSQIDKKLEISGLNDISAERLKRSVILHLMTKKLSKWTLAKHMTEFTRDVEEKQITDIKTIPLILMYLLFLWCNGIDLGHSQCDLYSQITELLLSRAVRNNTELAQKIDLPQGDIYQCFSGKIHCTKFCTLLTALGQLAYRTLFNKTREENTLVFDGSVAEQYLNKEYLNFFLKTGLITQSNVPGNLLVKKSKVSFAHKTVQEFFAALYMNSTSDQTSVPEIVLSKCKCIKDILEMSKILKFSCGMNAKVSSLISREMMKIINKDEITSEYRSSLESSTSISHPLKDFQNMCISCCEEIPRKNDVSLCLQDVFIETSRMQKQYRESLKQLTTKNKQNIRSLYIKIENMDNMRHTPYKNAHEVIEYFEVNDLENIEKIHYKGEYNDSDVLPLLNTSVKCLCLWCIRPGDPWSQLLFKKVTSLQKLDAIHINGFKMSHNELTLLYDYISQRHCMHQIELSRLNCTDPKRDHCTGYSLDLSQHSQLNKLTLDDIPILELSINMASLEKCRLWFSINPDLVLCFKNCVPANSKLNTFKCWKLASPAAIETMLETLRLSLHVKHVELGWINLGNREVLSSEMIYIERVELKWVTMPASILQGIVDVVQQQPRTVKVDINRCVIKPESEFVTVKKKIKKSRKCFKVEDDHQDWFRFETKVLTARVKNVK